MTGRSDRPATLYPCRACAKIAQAAVGASPPPGREFPHNGCLLAVSPSAGRLVPFPKATLLMTPFRRVPGNPLEVMMKRDLLLSQPDDFFRPLFGGRTPTIQERLHYVEVAV